MATQLCACSSLLRLFCVVVGIIFVASFNEKRALNLCFFSFRFGYFELEQRLHNFDIVDDGSGNVNTFFSRMVNHSPAERCMRCISKCYTNNRAKLNGHIIPNIMDYISISIQRSIPSNVEICRA